MTDFNLDKFITKVCNSLLKSGSHWKSDGYTLRNKQTHWWIWIANEDYGLTIWKQCDPDFNDALDKAIWEYPSATKTMFPTNTPPKELQMKLWTAYTTWHKKHRGQYCDKSQADN